jgi:hypothetical protein
VSALISLIPRLRIAESPQYFLRLLCTFSLSYPSSSSSMIYLVQTFDLLKCVSPHSLRARTVNLLLRSAGFLPGTLSLFLIPKFWNLRQSLAKLLPSAGFLPGTLSLFLIPKFWNLRLCVRVLCVCVSLASLEFE